MNCPSCFHNDTKVLDSRSFDDGTSIRRRRECEKCGFRFSTYEEVEILNLTVEKRDGSFEPYDREKIVIGLKRALEKRDMDHERFKRLVNAIERDIQMNEKSDRIASARIGELVMKHLRRADKIAYIRFASVYKSFEEVEHFQEILDMFATKKVIKSLKKKKEPVPAE
ncbi:MAG: transcriptional repressor NrdR [Candidatus Kerfeldbacteria bacterium]|nr:transcriptional repressor NrdR [Candidatus Kerfeldbacteria bacterium]